MPRVPQALYPPGPDLLETLLLPEVLQHEQVPRLPQAQAGLALPRLTIQPPDLALGLGLDEVGALSRVVRNLHKVRLALSWICCESVAVLADGADAALAHGHVHLFPLQNFPHPIRLLQDPRLVHIKDRSGHFTEGFDILLPKDFLMPRNPQHPPHLLGLVARIASTVQVGEKKAGSSPLMARDDVTRNRRGLGPASLAQQR